MKNKITKFSFFLISLLFFSCEYGIHEAFFRERSVNERANQITNLTFEKTLPDNPEYKILLISDVHIGSTKYGNENENIKAFLEKVSEIDNILACFATGDLAEHGYKSEFQKYKAEITDKLEEQNIKTYNLLGNHDLYNSGFKSFKKICYPYNSFFKLQTQNVSFYALDSANGTFGQKQIFALQNSMKNDKNKKIILSHYPFFAEGTNYFVLQDSEERNSLISLLYKNNTILAVNGHRHEYYKSDLGFTEENLSALFKHRSFFILNIKENSDTDIKFNLEKITF